MKIAPTFFATALVAPISLLAQAQPVGGAAPLERNEPQPIYRVTVVSRTLQAVNYEHRGGPTMIDFKGTVLLPEAKGQAVVESKRGSVNMDVRFERLEPPTRFGPEYLTYVLWAVSPEGRPKNLGEVLTGTSNKGHLTVSADLQAFGMIVTAEPYYAVTTPSDVVVLENVVRPDTIGTREPVVAKYELLPRGQYTMTLRPEQLHSMASSQAQSLPYNRYEALLELYQAQNALQMAQSLGADHYAPESYQKAATLLQNAQQMYDHKGDTHAIVSSAREAAQTAEDARTIAIKRRDDERIEREKDRARQEQGRLKIQAERDAVLAQAQAQAEQAEADRAREQAAREQYEAAMAREQAREAERQRAAAQAVPPPAPPQEPTQLTPAQRDARAQLLRQLNAVLPTNDTPRGLVVVLSGASLEAARGDVPRPEIAERLMRVATAISKFSLAAQVEGYTGSRGGDAEAESQRSAHRVRALLLQYGADPNAVTAVGLGDSRPVASNATAESREQNRRVEIVIGGASIGDMPLWERTYSLKPQK